MTDQTPVRPGFFISLFLWALLIVAYVSTSVDAQVVASLISGVLVGLGFTWIGWLSLQSEISPPLAALKAAVSQQIGWASLGLGISVTVVAGVLGRGTIYGLQPAEGLLAVVVFPFIGVILGGLMYFGMEIDEGFRHAAGFEATFSFVFTGLIWTLFAAALLSTGGALFFLTLIITRVVAAAALYLGRSRLNDGAIDQLTPDLMIALIMVVPVAALVFGIA